MLIQSRTKVNPKIDQIRRHRHITVTADVLPGRWRHVQAVATRAERLSAILGVAGHVLVAAAWLYDIGYAPDLHEEEGSRVAVANGMPLLARPAWRNRAEHPVLRLTT
jgi:HD superfamily phosphodiesterase